MCTTGRIAACGRSWVPRRSAQRRPMGNDDLCSGACFVNVTLLWLNEKKAGWIRSAQLWRRAAESSRRRRNIQALHPLLQYIWGGWTPPKFPFLLGGMDHRALVAFNGLRHRERSRSRSGAARARSGGLASAAAALASAARLNGCPARSHAQPRPGNTLPGPQRRVAILVPWIGWILPGSTGMM